MPELATRDQAAIRDIPRTCTCRWQYVTAPARWLCTRPDPACIWHAHATRGTA